MNQDQYCSDTMEWRMHELYQLAKRCAETQSSILITGKSGTGKESICRLIHDSSPQANEPYVAINCAAIPESLIEAELFGYEAGAFTGADSITPGKFELAERGTIVLDEIGEMNLKTQAKILRVLETHEFYRIGGQQSLKINTRVIATTNRDLKKLVKLGLFREDLYYRLDVLRLEMPALKERNKDIPLFVDYFVNQLNIANGKNIDVTPEVYHLLCQKKWEGNIRELKNHITRMYYLTEGNVISANDIDDKNLDLSKTKNQISLLPQDRDLSLYEVEKFHILNTIQQTHGNKSKAARLLKISLKTLRSKLKEYDFNLPDVAIIAKTSFVKKTDAVVE